MRPPTCTAPLQQQSRLPSRVARVADAVCTRPIDLHPDSAPLHAQGSRSLARAAAQAPGAATATAAGVPVSIVVPACRLAFGEGLRLVGSCSELGDWDAARGAVLTWQEGDNWAAQLDMPAGTHSFKLVITRPDGSCYWEPGDNRSLAVPQQSGSVPVSATCRFGDTSATEVQGAKDVAPAALKASSASSGAASPAAATPAAAAATAKPAAAAGSNGASAAAVAKLSAAKALTSEQAAKAAELVAEAVKAVEGQPAITAEAEQLQASRCRLCHRSVAGRKRHGMAGRVTSGPVLSS